MPRSPTDIKAFHNNATQRADKQRLLLAERLAAAEKARAFMQTVANEFAKQQGVSPEQVIVHMCNRGRK